MRTSQTISSDRGKACIDAYHRGLLCVQPGDTDNIGASMQPAGLLEHGFSIPHQIADGGETRFHSVKSGLAFVTTPGLVGVHDGVRPFVAQEVIARCYSLAAGKQAVIPVTDVVETVRHLVGEGSETVSRDAYKLVQTPQVFDADLLKQAYEQPYTSHFTDDASVVEALGKPVYLTEGNRENIKITTPFDLKIAAALLDSCSI